MDPLNLPEDLTGISDEELAELQDAIAEQIDALRSQDPASMTDEDIATVERVVAARDRVRAEAERRDQIARELAERAAAALAALDETDDEDDEDDEDGEELADDTDVETAEETDDNGEDDDEDPSANAAEETPVPAAASTGGDRTATASVVRTPAGRPVGRQLTTGLERVRPRSHRPRKRSKAPFMVASAHVTDVPGLRQGSPLPDMKAVAAAITEKRRRMRPVPPGIKPELVALAIGTKDLSFHLGKDDTANFAVLEEVRRRHADVVSAGFSQQALVASGGCCAPYTPLYEFFRLAVPDSSIEDSLPVVGAARGGIRYIACTDWRTAVSGIGEYTCEDSADPEFEGKPCVHAVCPGIEEAEVQAVTQCVRFDNLQYRVFPEMTESFLADLAVAFQERKEAFFRAQFAATSTATTVTPAYGSARAVLGVGARAAYQYRARQAMDRDAQLLWYLPSWLLEAMAVDVRNDAGNGTMQLSGAKALILDAFAEHNITPVWYRDLRTANDGPAAAQGAGALNAWTDDAVTWMHAPGTYVKLDGGTLDVGLVRDSQLNATNDLELFMEEWLGLAMVGCESVQITITSCPTGAAPQGASVGTCSTV